METLAVLLAAALGSPPQVVAARGCAVPNAPAQIVRAAQPNAPVLGGERHVMAVVSVLVSLDALGDVTGTRITRSSSSTLVDRAAIDAAKRSIYQPAVRRCVAVPSTYTFSTTIDSL